MNFGLPLHRVQTVILRYKEISITLDIQPPWLQGEPLFQSRVEPLVARKRFFITVTAPLHKDGSKT